MVALALAKPASMVGPLVSDWVARTDAPLPTGVAVPDAAKLAADTGVLMRAVTLPIVVLPAAVTGTPVITALTRPLAVITRS